VYNNNNGQFSVYFDLSEDLFQIDVGSTDGSTGKVARCLVKWNLGRKHYAVSFPLLTKSDVASIVEHCMQVLHAIDTRVGVQAPADVLGRTSCHLGVQ
jgi:hypothetical protein